MAAVVFAATNPVSANPIPQGLEERLLEEGGVRRGICAVLGIDADLSLRLARESGLLVHVRDAPSSFSTRDVIAPPTRVDGSTSKSIRTSRLDWSSLGALAGTALNCFIPAGK